MIRYTVRIVYILSYYILYYILGYMRSNIPIIYLSNIPLLEYIYKLLVMVALSPWELKGINYYD